MPFPATLDDITPGVPTVGYVSAIQDVVDAVLGGRATTVGIAVMTVTFGVWSPIVPTVHVTPWVTGIANKAWATQKRRGAFGRLNKGPF
jgi:hypothetical protein